MSRSHIVLRYLRRIHLYVGVFTTPALLFFAFTGAMQSVNLHETTQGSSYKPPAWLVSLAQLHKKQTTEVPVRRPRPAGAEPQGQGRGAGVTGPGVSGPGVSGLGVPPKGHWPMKIFFVLVSVGLLLSTLTGVYMAYKYSRSKWVITAWLAAGIILPLVLLPF